jgi:hypothetical protein
MGLESFNHSGGRRRVVDLTHSYFLFCWSNVDREQDLVKIMDQAKSNSD